MILMTLMTGVQVYEFNVPTFGKGVVFDVDHKVCSEWSTSTTTCCALQSAVSVELLGGQVRAEQFRFFAEALKSAKLKVYVPHFVREAEVIRLRTCSTLVSTSLV